MERRRGGGKVARRSAVRASGEVVRRRCSVGLGGRAAEEEPQRGESLTDTVCGVFAVETVGLQPDRERKQHACRGGWAEQARAEAKGQAARRQRVRGTRSAPKREVVEKEARGGGSLTQAVVRSGGVRWYSTRARWEARRAAG